MTHVSSGQQTHELGKSTCLHCHSSQALQGTVSFTSENCRKNSGLPAQPIAAVGLGTVARSIANHNKFWFAHSLEHNALSPYLHPARLTGIIATMVALSTIASLLSLHTIYAAATVHFPYEQEHLTVENINDILIERLPKQSRIQGTNFTDYLSQFLFYPIDVTGDHKTDVSYDLPGPHNCKIFPGDSSWPSTWSWAGLNLAALGGLIKPAPMSHVCYTNGTDGEDEAACASLAQKWNTARFMCVAAFPIRLNPY